MTHRQSRGQITGFEVTLWNSENNLQHTEIVSADTFAVPINFTQVATFSSDIKVTATIFARNSAGLSQPASVVLPLHLTGMAEMKGEWCYIYLLSMAEG